jgi:hypothetical protein
MAAAEFAILYLSDMLSISLGKKPCHVIADQMSLQGSTGKKIFGANLINGLVDRAGNLRRPEQGIGARETGN